MLEKLIKLHRKDTDRIMSPTKRFRGNVKSNEAATHTTCNSFQETQLQVIDPSPLEDAPVHESTPWPEAGKVSGNLSQRKKGLATYSQLPG